MVVMIGLLLVSFNNTQSNANISHILAAKLVDTGSVSNRTHQPQRAVRNEDVEVGVLGHVAYN